MGDGNPLIFLAGCHVGKPPAGLHESTAQEAKQEEDPDEAVAYIGDEPSVEGEPLMGQLHSRNIIVPKDKHGHCWVQHDASDGKHEDRQYVPTFFCHICSGVLVKFPLK